MAQSFRTNLLTKVHKVLKKHYKPVRPNMDRPVLEQLLFACCLENAHYQPAEEAFDSLSTTFFDWNEVRVSTVNELAEALHVLPDPAAAATRLKRALQSAFESIYAFDLESLRKQNLGPATARLQKLDGTTPFVTNYVVQTCLGGHAVPVDSAAFELLQIIGVISESETKSGNVPGMERAVPKTKGIEFGSLLHQFAADFAAGRYSPDVHKIILEINPDAKDRLPKRTRKRPTAAAKPEKTKKQTKGGTKKTRAQGSTTRKTKSATKASSKPSAAKKRKKKPTAAKAAKKKVKKTSSRKLTKRKPR